MNKKAELTSYVTETGVTINKDTIKDYICPEATDEEAIMFLQMCKAQGLNPFLRDAYLIKYKGSPAQMVVGKETYTKRATSNPNYKGMKAGIIVRPKKGGEFEKREGSLYIKAEEIIVGGWCEVYLVNQEFPVYSSVSFDEYNTGKSLWASKPAVMIRKVAIVTALREAFPKEFQGLYDSSEMAEIEGGALPEKPIDPEQAPPMEKRKLLALAIQKNILKDSKDKEGIEKLENILKMNDLDLHNLSPEDCQFAIDIISKIDNDEDKEEENNTNESVIDADFEEVDEGEKEPVQGELL